MLNRLEMLRIFCAAAEAQTFKDAAVRLGISPQAVTRGVRELEDLLGEPLFHRNTRGSRITEFGEQFVLRARARVEEIDALFQKSVSTEDDLKGLVRITATQALGAKILMPVLCELMSQNPGLRLDLRLSDVPSDVVDERIDVGIRVGLVRDNRFVARRVSTERFHFVGSPELISRCGMPNSVEALVKNPMTVLIDASTGRPWPWMLSGGRQFFPVEPVFASNDPAAECEAVLAGLGFGQLAGVLAKPHILAGRLVPFMSDQAPEPWDLYVYRPQRGPVPARVRLVFDRLVDLLSNAAPESVESFA